MALREIEVLLQQVMGLHAETIGSSSVARAVQGRMTACGLVDADDYYERLAASQRELQELIETVIVPETWFFRDPEAFAELKRIACEEWRPNRAGDVVRILSIACATGEEPYSIAMALFDAGFASDRFRIDAVDISERSLDHARSGIYGSNSFRGDDLGFRARYFQKIAEGHRVHEAVRETVRFHYGNVHAEGFFADALPYDAVFCRNLLIYFDQPTQVRAIAVCRRLLKEAGTLFVGPAETVSLLNRDFVSVKVPLAFAFRMALPAAPPRVVFPPLPELRVNAKSTTPAVRSAPREPVQAPPEARVSLPPQRNGIEEAFVLADKGHLVEAAALCEEQIRNGGASAQAFYLMGLICSAEGRLYAADRCYRKALYLDENHVDAMTHLAVLLEEQGDRRGAKLLRDRAQKL